MNIQWIGSPNFDKNSKPKTKIVLHWMAGTLAGTDKVFQDTKRGTSAHYGIEDREVHQYVNTDHVAYHAGVYKVNQESIGIEHSAAPGRDATPLTIETSINLIVDLCRKYNIPADRQHIIKHSEIKATQCPGTIPIDYIVEQVALKLKGAPPMAGLTDREYRDLYYKELGLNGVVAIGERFGDKPPEKWADEATALTSYTGVVKGKVDKALAAKDKAESEKRVAESNAKIYVEELSKERELTKQYEARNLEYAGTINSLSDQVTLLELQLEEAKAAKPFDWQRFTSRKFLVALLGSAVPVLNQAFGWQLNIDQILTIVGPLLLFVGVEGYADIKERVIQAKNNLPKVGK